VIGYSELALHSLDETSEEHAHISAILKAGTRAADLVRQIMTFSRQTEEESKPVKLGQIVKDALKLIRATIPAVDYFSDHYAEATALREVLDKSNESGQSHYDGLVSFGSAL
jgi:signal transduction histidine kinase